MGLKVPFPIHRIASQGPQAFKLNFKIRGHALLETVLHHVLHSECNIHLVEPLVNDVAAHQHGFVSLTKEFLDEVVLNCCFKRS